MTRVKTPTRTDKMLVEMLTENTGRHMLDSGGAHGRNWERNQGHTVGNFLDAPAVYLEYDYVVLDLFHWLRDRLEYDPELDRKLQVWSALYGDDMSWLEIVETFASKVTTGKAYGGNFNDGYLAGTYNSYNHEDALSQTIQFVLYEDPETDEPVVLLQIHGGCDVRGGYTRPRAFRVCGDASDMLDFDQFSLHCTKEHPGDPLPGMPDPGVHALDHRNGEWTTYEGSFESDPWGGEEWMREGDDGVRYIWCPYCEDGTPMALDVR